MLTPAFIAETVCKFNERAKEETATWRWRPTIELADDAIEVWSESCTTITPGGAELKILICGIVPHTTTFRYLRREETTFSDVLTRVSAEARQAALNGLTLKEGLSVKAVPSSVCLHFQKFFAKHGIRFLKATDGTRTAHGLLWLNSNTAVGVRFACVTVHHPTDYYGDRIHVEREKFLSDYQGVVVIGSAILWPIDAVQDNWLAVQDTIEEPALGDVRKYFVLDGSIPRAGKSTVCISGTTSTSADQEPWTSTQGMLMGWRFSMS